MKHHNFGIKKSSVLFAVVIAIGVAAQAADQDASRPKRACDDAIAKYCSGSDDHGPGCLKGHESDVSSACLKDMQHQGGPGGGEHRGPPPPADGSGNSEE